MPNKKKEEVVESNNNSTNKSKSKSNSKSKNEPLYVIPKKIEKNCIAVLKMVDGSFEFVVSSDKYDLSVYNDVIKKIRYELPIVVHDNNFVNAYNIVKVYRG